MTTISAPNMAISQMNAKIANEDALLGKKVTPEDAAKVKQASEDFEALFLGIVLKSMRNSVQKSGFVDGGNAEQIYQSMLDGEYSKSMASQRNTGLADAIEGHLLRSMGVKNPIGNTAKISTGIEAYRSQGLQIEPKQAKMVEGVNELTPPKLR